MRRGLLALPLAAAAIPAHAATRPPRDAALAEWEYFKTSFLRPEGRVVDNYNGGVSHSEGQGFTMLMAVRFDEPETFATLLRWTRATLSRPDDHLLAWCHRPGEAPRPSDRNNATDGDLFVAWALAEAADKWGQPNYRALSVAMCRDILGKLVVQSGDRSVLLPGIMGFRERDTLVVNPSYYIYPAFNALRRVHASPAWSSLETSGLRLARSARFGRWGLVPDWVAMSGSMPGRPGIAPGRAPRFSYDAVRVPLYLAWGGFGSEPLVEAASRFWHDPSLPRMPAWADLRTDEIAPYAADPGIAGVAWLSARASGQAQPGRSADAARPPYYYSSALRLLSRLAMTDMAEARRQVVAAR
ncbi:glycosyl hydrolase family 8 [Roseococcus sp. YIM B11640]|uniref:glycosyl hydrolase family 8 n=1 Tax=Roseococcus sp. YIM B11640 TaxID=3133973 RepID=UPI003C7C5BDB